MTWLAVPLLALGVAAIRLAGFFLAGPLLTRHPVLVRASALIPVAVVAGLVAQLGLTANATVAFDERALGLLVAGLLVWRRAPFIVIVVGAAATVALLRSF